MKVSVSEYLQWWISVNMEECGPGPRYTGSTLHSVPAQQSQASWTRLLTVHSTGGHFHISRYLLCKIFAGQYSIHSTARYNMYSARAVKMHAINGWRWCPAQRTYQPHSGRAYSFITRVIIAAAKTGMLSCVHTGPDQHRHAGNNIQLWL